MSTETSSLSTLARSKLHKCNLHRWVLLKNSIIQHAVPSTASTSSHTDNTYTELAQAEVEDEEVNTEDADSFMFPDAGKFAPGVDSDASEEQWLDSLLETLGEDDDDDLNVESVLQADDDELSPLPSPMSSSDDLSNQTYLSHSYPFLAPYPPYHPPLINPFHFDSPGLPVSPYVDPLPYYELDDVADQPVPDAIEDTSDDESDSPSIQSSSLLTLNGPARPTPHVFIDSDDSAFYPYELDTDPLPFSDSYRPAYEFYQEC